MAKIKPGASGGFVYSTNPDFLPAQQNEMEAETTLPALQKLKISLDKKHRAGKAVTIIDGFTGTLGDMEDLGKKLKTYCGTGGAVKEGAIIVQGDNRDKILQWLHKNGYNTAKKI